MHQYTFSRADLLSFLSTDMDFDIVPPVIFTKKAIELFSTQLTESSCILQLDFKHLHGSGDHHLTSTGPTPCQHLPP